MPNEPVRAAPLSGWISTAASPALRQEAVAPPKPKSLTRFRREGGGQAKPSTTAGTTQAQTKAPGKPPVPPDPRQQCYTTLLMMAGFLALIYFLMIRPQKKQEQERKAMLEALKKGDRIVTSGGIHGQVVSVDEKTVVMKFGGEAGQRLTIDRSAVARVLQRGQEK